MSDALAIQVADEVVTELLAASLSQSVTPVRSYADWTLELKNAASLRVDVVPVANEVKIEADCRDGVEYDIAIDIAVRKKFSQDDRDEDTGDIQNSSVDPLTFYVEEIAENFVLNRFADLEVATWQGTKIEALFIPQHLRELSQFTGIVRLSFQASRTLS